MPEVVSATTGLPGCGKTFARVRWLCDEFLHFSDGIFYTNFPLKVEKFVEYFQANFDAGKFEVDGEEVRRRLVVIPREVEETWQNEESGPWEYFADIDLSDAHIAIDEAHTVIGNKHSAGHRRNWQAFTGELRHRGAELELISQSYTKLAAEVMVDVALRRQLVNGDQIPDPIFGIPFGDWHQLQASRTGKKPGFVRQIDQRQVDGRKWEQVGEWKEWRFDNYYFEFYDSHATPKNGGKSGKKTEPFERFKGKKFAKWFAARNAVKLIFSNPAKVILLGLIGMGLVQYVKTTGTLVPAGELPKRQKAEVGSAMAWAPQSQPGYAAAAAAMAEDKTRITAMFDDALMAFDGQVYRIGEEFNGKQIESINVSDGVCVFSDGGMQKLSTFVDDGSRTEGVRQPVQRPQTNPAQSGGEVGQSGSRDTPSVQRTL